MKAGIYYNRKYFSDNKSYVERLKKLLAEKGAESKAVEGCADLDGIDVLFVLGGDGTILTIAAACALKKVRIIGINYGHLGFLAEFEPEKLDEAVALVCSGDYQVQQRSMLEITCGKKTLLALNDLAIQRSTSGINFCNTVNLHAEIDGATVDNFSSDGIIISTPTGSTAYSLAAGGSVLAPDINAFISGASTDPPAASEYAVEPVGVLIIIPSDEKLSTVAPSISACRFTVLQKFIPLVLR